MSLPAHLANSRPTPRPVPKNRAGRRASLSALILFCTLLSCSPGEKEFTFLVRERDNRAVAGIEVRLAGEDRRLGVTDDKGRATVRVPAAKGVSLRFRLTDAAKPESPRYQFPEVIELEAGALESGVKTIWLDAAGTTEPDSAGPATVRITSDPPGGQAFLDGAEVGRTPAALPNVPPGRHQIEVRMAGRQPFAMEVYLEAGEQTFHAPLPPREEARATLRVTSDPAGARIVLDGRSSGRVTPASLEQLAPGRHVLRLEMDGYEPFETSVELTAGGPGGSAGGTLRPRLLTARDLEEAGRGSAETARDSNYSREYLISTAPGWAEVYVDGETSNRNLAGRFKAVLSGGPHTFRILNAKAGVDVSLKFVVKPGSTDKRLVLNYATGQVEARP